MLHCPLQYDVYNKNVTIIVLKTLSKKVWEQSNNVSEIYNWFEDVRFSF